MTSRNNTVYLSQYQPPGFLVEMVDIKIELGQSNAIVTTRIEFTKNPDSAAKNLELFGKELKLLSISLNDSRLSDYELNDDRLIIPSPPNIFSLLTKVEIYPDKNTSLMGLYKSGTMFCTQCESEGFRKITYFPDRPDIMAKFTTTLVASKQDCPVLLSNGNLIERGDLGDRHYAVWQDPFKKPSYLFAIVAGDLVAIEDSYLTKSKRLVALKIYVERQNLEKAGFAMQSLKKSMQWDEEVFAREYDLDIYMIVAVDDFNMGAMENKGLNVFNSKYVLVSPDTATDLDYSNVDRVVGHEYFHNWSGNRVTCRDWFQLSLKEGFTVFREQRFCEDITQSAVSRIEQVDLLRTRQFAEDAGPMAHAVRPESYQEINNFYTVTIYEKGAELIRMLNTILGPTKFREGCDLYFAKHDGQAVTTDDFVAAMEQASGIDLSQFKLWYSQIGTPEITIDTQFDAKHNTYSLTLGQSLSAIPKQDNLKPMCIPISVALLDKQGKHIPLCLQDEQSSSDTKLLILTDKQQTFTFKNVAEKPVLSCLRDFSAPVKITTEFDTEDLLFLLRHDSDPFNRWDATRKLYEKQALILANDSGASLDPNLVSAYGDIIQDDRIDLNLKSSLLALPSLQMVLDAMTPAVPATAYTALNSMRHSLANEYTSQLLKVYNDLSTEKQYSYNANDVAERKLKNTCLKLLSYSNHNEVLQIVIRQYNSSNNMTDKLSALSILANISDLQAQACLDDFYSTWKHVPLVVNKWLQIQAISELPDTLDKVISLCNHAAFNIKNPNKVYALLYAFAGANPYNFHHDKSYQFITDKIIEIDQINPHVSGRLIGAFVQWRKYTKDLQDKMSSQLQRIASCNNLSTDLQEIIDKSL